MSKLAEAMRRAARREARSIGFTTATATRNPTMLVLARGTAAGVAEAAAKGADGVIITDGPAPKKAIPGGVLWGTEAAVNGRAGTKAVREAGAGFLVFDADSTDAAALLDEELGYIMRIDLEATDTLLRTIDSLPLDALLVPGLDGALTVRRALDLRRIASFARKALILQVADGIDPVDLEALRDCGVIGVVTDGAAGAATLRAKVDALPPRRRQGDGRGISLALRATGDSYPVEELPEPDEDH